MPIAIGAWRVSPDRRCAHWRCVPGWARQCASNAPLTRSGTGSRVQDKAHRAGWRRNAEIRRTRSNQGRHRAHRANEKCRARRPSEKPGLGCPQGPPKRQGDADRARRRAGEVTRPHRYIVRNPRPERYDRRANRHRTGEPTHMQRRFARARQTRWGGRKRASACLEGVIQ